jgi:hypothetical protein
VKLNELNLSHVLGDYGAAAVKQVGNRIAGKAEGNLSVQDKIAKDKFVADFIGRASTNLNSAIQSGLVNPKVQANPAGGNTNPQQPNTAQQPEPTTQQPAATSAPKTPDQIRQEKQGPAAQAAQADMAKNTPQTPAGQQPAPAQPGAPAATAQQSKMTPQQVAALKGRLKAGATATSGQSGFKNYVGGSGERMTGVDGSGAPVFKKIQREGTYSKLDYILESIINIDEAQKAQSISEYLQNMFNQYLKVPITDPKGKAQIKTLADQAQATYGQDKGKAALTQMANLGFAMSYSQGAGATQDAGATTEPKSALSSFGSGFKQALSGNASASDTDAETAERDKQTASAMTGLKGQLYDNVMSIVGKMSKDEKQQLLTSLTKPETSTAPEAPTSNAGAGAFDQMSKQLQQPKTTANPVNRQQKLNTNKVKAGNKGAPTSAEYDKFDKLTQQALAKQA